MTQTNGNLAQKVVVLGGGSFGSALSYLVAQNGYRVQQWMRDQEQVDAINSTRINQRYMPEYTYPENVTATTDMHEACDGAVLHILSLPSKAFRMVCKQLAKHVDGSHVLVSTTKGIEAGTFSLMSDIILQETAARKVGVISGPNLAKEIMAGMPTGTVIASEYNEVVKRVQTVLGSPNLRVYSNADIHGVELAGALKNIYAVASGMVSALKLGENTRSMLITRSLVEMSRMAAKLGANPMTFLGLAGVGDLVATCSSPLSRNFRVGFALGEGKTLAQAVDALGQTAEGVNTIEQVKGKADLLGVRMPIVQGLYAVLFEQLPVSEAMGKLMSGDFVSDVDFVQGS